MLGSNREEYLLCNCLTTQLTNRFDKMLLYKDMLIIIIIIVMRSDCTRMEKTKSSFSIEALLSDTSSIKNIDSPTSCNVSGNAFATVDAGKNSILINGSGNDMLKDRHKINEKRTTTTLPSGDKSLSLKSTYSVQVSCQHRHMRQCYEESDLSGRNFFTGSSQSSILTPISPASIFDSAPYSAESQNIDSIKNHENGITNEYFPSYCHQFSTNSTHKQSVQQPYAKNSCFRRPEYVQYFQNPGVPNLQISEAVIGVPGVSGLNLASANVNSERQSIRKSVTQNPCSRALPLQTMISGENLLRDALMASTKAAVTGFALKGAGVFGGLGYADWLARTSMYMSRFGDYSPPCKFAPFNTVFSITTLDK